MLANIDMSAVALGYFVGLVFGSLITAFIMKLVRCENCCQKD